jgi:hypothetical protein
VQLRTWPEQDQRWVERYRTAMAGPAGKAVPSAVRQSRERELLDAVCEAGVPAAELFGDAAALAADDAAELATVDEAVRTSGGRRTQARAVRGRRDDAGSRRHRGPVHGGPQRLGVDVDAASVLLMASLAAVYVGWVGGRALHSAGRSAATIALAVGVLTVAVCGIAVAEGVGPDRLLARDVPVPLLAVALLTPGVLLLVASSRMAQPTLQGDWDDAAWLRRFRGGLRARLVPAATARGHVAEVEQAIRTGRGRPSPSSVTRWSSRRSWHGPTGRRRHGAGG